MASHPFEVSWGFSEQRSIEEQLNAQGLTLGDAQTIERIQAWADDLGPAPQLGLVDLRGRLAASERAGHLIREIGERVMPLTRPATAPPAPLGVSLRKLLTDAINRASAEAGSNTPDFVLADYLVDCLDAFDRATQRRQKLTCPDKPQREADA